MGEIKRLELKLSQLLYDCASLLETAEQPADPLAQTLSNPVAYKWIIDKEGKAVCRQMKNEANAVSYACFFSFSKIADLASYKECRDAFKKNNFLKEASKLAGKWASFENIFQTILMNYGRIRRKKVVIDIEAAKKAFLDICAELSKDVVIYEARTRLVGVVLKSKQIALPNGLILYRLSKKEINSRQPFIDPLGNNIFPLQNLLGHPTELQISIKEQVDRSKPHAYFVAQNRANAKANKVFQNLLEALSLVKDGKMELGPKTINGGPVSAGSSIPFSMHIPAIPPPKVTIKKSDINKISKAYNIISEGDHKDDVLSRALHRFFLGKQRSNPIDKIIDYMIAWEILLLTSKGDPVKSELGYRFALNGSSLISAATEAKDNLYLFDKYDRAYDVRSRIVHGNSEKDINKALRKKNSFSDLQDLANFLEANLKKAALWLSDIEPEFRPYRKERGWEDFLW